MRVSININTTIENLLLLVDKKRSVKILVVNKIENNNIGPIQAERVRKDR